MNKWLVGLLAGLIGLLNANAQDGGNIPWSLKTCIQHALDKGVSAQSGKLNVESAEINYNQSKLNLLPSLNANASHNYSFGTTINPLTNSYESLEVQSNSLGLNSGVNLFNGFSNVNNVKQQQYNYLASKKELEVTQNNVSLSVANQYLQVLQNKELLKVAVEQLKSSKLQLENMKKQIEAGRRAEGDKYTLEAQVASDEMGVQQASNNVALSLLTLKNMLLIPADSWFDIKVPSTDFLNAVKVDTAAKVEEIYEKFVDERPEVQAATMRRQAASYQLKMAKGALSPSLNFGANLNSRYAQDNLSPIPSDPFRKQLEDNFGQSLGFSLSVPIFNGLNSRNNIKLAKINVEQVDLRKKEAENQYLADLSQARASFLLAEKSLFSANKNRMAQKNNAEFNKKRMDAGALDFASYTLSQNNYIIAESQYIQAKYQYVFSGMVLNFYKGLPIELE